MSRDDPTAPIDGWDVYYGGNDINDHTVLVHKHDFDKLARIVHEHDSGDQYHSHGEFVDAARNVVNHLVAERNPVTP